MRLAAGDADAAFARAAHRVGQRMTSQRIAPVTLEPRGVLAWVSGDPRAGDGRLEVRLPTQRPHGSRRWLSAMLGLPPERIHVVAGDVGGAFGAKGPIYPDQVAVIFAALALGRPVKWIEERGESFLATTHGRDQVADLEMAVAADGRITALRGVVHAGFGAYYTPNAPGSLLGRLGPMLPQGYRISSIDVELVGVLANTPPIGPYRGAGRPEGAYFCERLVDLAATATGLDPAELRRRNFIAPGRVPVHHVHRPGVRQRGLPGRAGGDARPAGPAVAGGRAGAAGLGHRGAAGRRDRLVRGAGRDHAGRGRSPPAARRMPATRRR